MAEKTARRRSMPPGAARVIFLVVPPVGTLDLFGPLSVFQFANRLVPRPRYRLEVLSAGALHIESDDGGPRIVADRVARTVPTSLDTLVVVSGATAPAFDDARVLRWVQRASARARRTVSVCTAAFVLARAGLLSARSATTHWAFSHLLSRAYPDVTVDPDRLWVRDGAVFTSAGVTTGIDLALALVADDLGSDLALAVARMLVVFVQRPGGQAQFSASLAAQESERAPIRELRAWMSDHLRDDLSVETLAARTGMSPRNFARVFASEVGMSPAKFVLRLRVEAAQRRLERSDDALEEVATKAGFASADVMYRAFSRVLGTTPAIYRASFRRTRGRAR
ncbi:MAG: helix-turn-helix domain-containing protein [Polyangiales bacterium]